MNPIRVEAPRARVAEDRQEILLPLAVALLAGLVLWSMLAGPAVARVLVSRGELAVYLVDKGILSAIVFLVLVRVVAFARVGFSPPARWRTAWRGVPLYALGVLTLSASGVDATVGGAIGWGIVALAVGFVEETVFRGVLWEALGAERKWTRALVTAAAFGAVHLVGLTGAVPPSLIVSQAMFAFGVGLTFAAMREAAGSIWPSWPHTLHSTGPRSSRWAVYPESSRPLRRPIYSS